MHGLESASPTNEEYLGREAVAYRYETVAADQFSKRAFTRTLNQVLKECKIATAEQAARFFKENSPCSSKAFQDLSNSISPERPKSEYELGLRKAFFTVALAFNIVDGKFFDKRLAATREERERALQKRNEQLRAALSLVTEDKLER